MIGLIGRGTVGGAIEAAYAKVNKPLIVVDKGDDFRALDECTMVWVAVPEWELSTVARMLTNRDALYVIKSTALPYQFNKLFKRFAYVPEFLTEANSKQDFYNPPLLPIGTSNQQDGDMILDELFGLNVYCYHAKIVSVAEASAIKYYANTFLATKVIFNNQFEYYCKHTGVDWNNIKGILAQDPRLGTSHWESPGPDGKYGYGGKCFPKDVRNLINNTDALTLLEEVDRINKSYRD
jgi:UDPglucose 6-dehydrogenase